MVLTVYLSFSSPKMEIYWIAYVVFLLLCSYTRTDWLQNALILRLVFADMQLRWRNVCMLSICNSRGCLPLHCVWQIISSLVYFRVYSKSDKKSRFSTIPEGRNNFIVHSNAIYAALLQGIVYELFIICCGLSRQRMSETKILKRQPIKRNFVIIAEFKN